MSIKIYFGPYEAHGIIRHKTQRLYGIMNRLSELGYHIELIPTQYLNVLTIEMRHKQVFRCNIKHLRFNMDIEDDPVGLTAVETVEEAKTRFYADENVPTFSAERKVHSATSQTDVLSYDIEMIYEIPTTYEEIRREERRKSSGVVSFM